MPRSFPRAAAMTLLISLASQSSSAQDEPITLADDPFEVTDPNATPPGEANLSVVGSYERAARGRVRSTIGAETELSVGVAPNLDFRIGQAGAYGNLDIRRRLGTVSTDQDDPSGESDRAALGGTSRVGALYQLSEERGSLPAVGLLGRVRSLYGPGRVAYDTEAIALFGKTLKGGDLPLGASLNVGWVGRLDPQPGERPHRYLLNVSIGQAISRDTVLVATYAREQQDRGDQDFSLVQAGVRHRLRSQKAIVGLAAGFGLNTDTPQFQIALAVQWELGASP
ncbi:hypothetical protein MOX02_36400 [Methylobacterium oxalidis]|uniref:Transporter n=2 Tax=Methylobacterium oxalidis TaxID=944322 RepID=A0A512J6S7_9HYPH|nr:hypothetical protein MOX02_36400 [Methylobacterium oxalidis]GLS65418.1 hypothetical protein GCM10007888_38000 [Methylobacterium oxalidis]